VSQNLRAHHNFFLLVWGALIIDNFNFVCEFITMSPELENSNLNKSFITLFASAILALVFYSIYLFISFFVESGIGFSITSSLYRNLNGTQYGLAVQTWAADIYLISTLFSIIISTLIVLIFGKNLEDFLNINFESSVSKKDLIIKNLVKHVVLAILFLGILQPFNLAIIQFISIFLFILIITSDLYIRISSKGYATLLNDALSIKLKK
jgi:hypothetical protein